MTVHGRFRRVVVVGDGATNGAVAEALADEFPIEAVEADDAGDLANDVDAVVAVDSVDGDALAVFDAVRERESLVPVVAVGVDAGADRVTALLSAGVSDYVDWRGGDGAAELRARLRALARAPAIDGAAQARRWDRIAGDLAHDAKNPLNVVAGRLELLDADPTHADAMERSVASVETLLEELSTVASVTGTARSDATVDVGAVVADVWAGLPTGDASLALQTGRSVAAPEAHVRLLLERLLENALHHGGEAVTVTVGDTDDGVSVADDGPGVDPDVRERAFEQGYTTDHDHEGYGLFVVDRVAAANGWTVTAGESDAGGARFDVRLDR